MEMLSLLGIIVGIAVFVFLAFKSFNLQLSALIATVVMLIFSGVNLTEGIFTTWMGGVASNLKNYFLIFCFGSIFGKIMADTGAAKRIAVTIATAIRNIKNKSTQKVMAAYFVPILYLILSYVGVSGFVIVFTVLGIGKSLYEECDVPWRLYCMGGASCAGTYFLGGSIAITNVAAVGVAGVSTAAAFGLSLICFIVFVVVQLVLLKFEIAKSEKRGEGFMYSGAEFAKVQVDEGMSEDELPSLLPSVIPLIVVILLCAVFGMNVSIALFIGCILLSLLCLKNLRKQSIKATIAAGMTSAYVPLMSVCCTAAIGTVIKTLPGYTAITGILSNLPPMYEGIALGFVFSFVVASGSAAIPAFGDVMFERFTEAGLSAEVAARLMTLSVCPSGILFHNAGVVNASSLAKIKYSQAIYVYGIWSFVPGMFSLVVGVLLIVIGVFH